MTPRFNISIGCFAILAAALMAWAPRPGWAFDATTDHACVANCGAPSGGGSTGGGGGGGGFNPMVNAVGTMSYGVGYAIGSAIRNGGAAPSGGLDPALYQANRQRLDQWEKEGASPAASDDTGAVADHGGLKVAASPQGNQPDAGDDSRQNTTLQVVNRTTSYLTVSIDGAYGCNTAGGTTCSIPVLKGHHMLRAVRTDTGESLSQPIDVPGSGLALPLSGS